MDLKMWSRYSKFGDGEDLLYFIGVYHLSHNLFCHSLVYKWMRGRTSNGLLLIQMSITIGCW